VVLLRILLFLQYKIRRLFLLHMVLLLEFVVVVLPADLLLLLLFLRITTMFLLNPRLGPLRGELLFPTLSYVQLLTATGLLKEFLPPN
jgi:hypothetical protein